MIEELDVTTEISYVLVSFELFSNVKGIEVDIPGNKLSFLLINLLGCSWEKINTGNSDMIINKVQVLIILYF